MLNIAYRELGLLPADFWDLTFREFNLLVDHRQTEVRRDWDVARTLGVWMMTPFSKKKLKPSDLLKLDAPPKASTREQFEQALKRYDQS